MQTARWKYLAIFLFIVIVGNIAGLWFMYIQQQQRLTQFSTKFDQLEKAVKNLTSQPVQTLPAMELIEEASSSTQLTSTSSASKNSSDIEKRLKAVEDEVKKLNQSSSVTSTSNSNTQNVKEYFVYLGSGTSSNTEWTNIPGAVVTIDANQYKNVKAVYFEAGLSISGGNAYARLINSDSGQVIYGTEVEHNTSTPTWKSSSGISLQSGNATYMVQLRSSSGEIVNLSGARIKIVIGN